MTRLIMLEGLPGTGKTTNSAFLQIQLERNGYGADWIHEVSRPQPLLFFGEACLTDGEYEAFSRTYPEAARVFGRIAVFLKNRVWIDLPEAEWNYLGLIGEDAFRALKEFDAWTVPLVKYKTLALERWAYFTEKALRDADTIYILDSAVFQAQIFWFLLNNEPYEDLERFVGQLLDIVRPLNPCLIYFYRDDPEATVGFLEKTRGIQCLQDIWERDKSKPYYRDKPAGAEGFRRFLRDYAAAAKKLFESAGCGKLAVEISEGDWPRYEDGLLSFLGIGRKPGPESVPQSGVYRNEALDCAITVDGLTITDPEGTVRRLTPKSGNEYYTECLPAVLRFEEPGRIVVSGRQICARWTTAGTVYEKCGVDRS
ncbi:MAG: hypothetical protein FWC55_04425 [Firmicutes bacterium]|nr:hypothetical protein [Bacillota bacterium]